MKAQTYLNEAGEVTFDAFEISCPKYIRHYFENAVLCAECTGRGCKRCFRNKGIESFWEYNYWHRDEDPIMNGVNYTACVKELQRPDR